MSKFTEIPQLRNQQANIISPAEFMEWNRQFRKEVFGIEINMKLHIPTASPEFGFVLVNPKGLTIQRRFDVAKEMFDGAASNWTNGNLDDVVTDNDRDPQQESIIRLRPNIEADEQFVNISADKLTKINHTGICLHERIDFETFVFWLTGDHCDLKNVTLCSGSRYSGGDVPYVSWSGGELLVGWNGASFSLVSLRSRKVVS